MLKGSDLRLALWLGLALLGLALAAYLILTFAFPGGTAAAKAQFSVGGVPFEFDARFLGPEREDGVNEIEAFFPDFSPAGETADVKAKTDVAARFKRTIFLGLRTVDPELDPADRTARLYLRFLGEAVGDEPGGLTGRAFDRGSPFAGDDLYFAPPEGREFAARCRASANPELPDTCAAVFRAGRVDVELRFSKNLLPEWQAMLTGAQKLVAAGQK